MLCKGRFRLGIGVGWNDVEYVALNENFKNRGKRSEEQVQVMQAEGPYPSLLMAVLWLLELQTMMAMGRLPVM